MQDISRSAAAHLEAIVSEVKELAAGALNYDLSDLPDSDLQRMITLARAAIERYAGHNSAYVRQGEEILKRAQTLDGNKMVLLAGVAESLKVDIEAGHLATIEQLVHGDIFDDYLEMASYLLKGNYKDAAAVIAGSTLEQHLRQLSVKHGVVTQTAGAGGLLRTKADTLNADLVRVSAYSKLDQKNITAWLDLRNCAAHGQYDAYSADQVALLIDGIRDFITRHPA